MKKEKTKPENLHVGHRKRMKEQYMTIGLNHCSDLHLLEMLLFYAIPRVDTNETAHRLLNKFKNVNGVLEASKEDLISVKGIGENAWLLIKTVREVSELMVSGSEDTVNLSDEKDLYDFFYSMSYSAVKECMNVVFLNYKMDVLGIYKYDCSPENPFKPSKTFGLFKKNGERFCVCAHVKPKSDPAADKEDIKLAYEFLSVLSQYSIELKDFLIVGNGVIRSAMTHRVVRQ